MEPQSTDPYQPQPMPSTMPPEQVSAATQQPMPMSQAMPPQAEAPFQYPQTQAMPVEPLPTPVQPPSIATPPVMQTAEYGAPQPLQSMYQAPQIVNPLAVTPDFQQAQDSMRKKILKIVIGLSLFSIIGAGLLFFFISSGDGTLNTSREDSNELATFQVPSSWKEESSADGTIEYFNGDSQQAPSALISVFKPQRIKFSGEPLTDQEIAAVLNELDGLQSNDLGEGVEILEQKNIEGTEFQKVVEYLYQAESTDGSTTIKGRFRVYFDKQAFLHGFEVAAVASYWESNQTKLATFLDNYHLKGE